MHRMFLRAKVFAASLIVMTVAGCSVATITPEQTQTLVLDRYLGNYCASKGWIENMSVAATYMVAIDEKLALASPEDMAKGEAFVKDLVEPGGPPRAACRSFELYANKVAQWRQEPKGQAYQGNYSQPAPTASAGITQCVDLGVITQCSQY